MFLAAALTALMPLAAYAVTIAVAGNSENASAVSVYNAVVMAAEESKDTEIKVVFIDIDDEDPAKKIREAGETAAVIGMFAAKNAGLMAQFPEIPFISLSPDYASLTINVNAFRAMISNSQMAQALCRADIKLFEKGSFAVLWEDGVEYENIAASYAETVRLNGGRLLYNRSAAADRDDYNAILIRIRELKAKVIFYAGSMEQAAKIAKQSKALNVGAVFTSTDDIYSKRFIKAAGPGADGAEFVTKFPASPYSFKASRPFLAAYDKRFGWPTGYVPFAYDAAQMVISAVKDGRTGIEGLKSYSYGGLTGKISFDGSRELVNPDFYLYIIRRNEFLNMKFTPSQRDDYNKAR